MINRWRYVRYTDDGCGLYQCLNCYMQWESRDVPGYHYNGRYSANWRFCPCCGIEWNGPIREVSYDNERMLGPRRLRREQLERQAWTDWNEQQYDYSVPSWKRAKIPRYDERHITHWWSLQVKRWIDWLNKKPGPPIVEYDGVVVDAEEDLRADEPWKTQLIWKGGMMPPRKMWFLVKEEMKRQQNEEDFYQRGAHIRLLVTRHRPSNGYICENYTLQEEEV